MKSIWILVGALHGVQEASLQVTELVEAEYRVIAGAAEVPVVGRALLIAVGRAHRAVHVEDEDFRLLAIMNPVDPDPQEFGQAENLVQLALGQEPNLGGDLAAVEFKPHPPGEAGLTRLDDGIALILIAESPRQVTIITIHLGDPGLE